MLVAPINFIVRPVDDRLYSNSDGGLIRSTTIEDHKFVNRTAEVIASPLIYNGPISAGDNVIVHHNIFRKFKNVKGEERFSNFKVAEGMYKANQETVFAYKKPGKEWVATDGFLFVTPVDNFDIFTSGKEKSLYGTIFITDEDKSIDVGTRVCFKPHSEYEFMIDGQKTYRIRKTGVCLIFQK